MKSKNRILLILANLIFALMNMLVIVMIDNSNIIIHGFITIIAVLSGLSVVFEDFLVKNIVSISIAFTNRKEHFMLKKICNLESLKYLIPRRYREEVLGDFYENHRDMLQEDTPKVQIWLTHIINAVYAGWAMIQFKLNVVYGRETKIEK